MYCSSAARHQGKISHLSWLINSNPVHKESKRVLQCQGVVCMHCTGMLPIKRQKRSAVLCIRCKHPHRTRNKRSDNKHPKCMTKLLQAGRLWHLVPHVTGPTMCRISTTFSTSNAAPSSKVHVLAVTGLSL